MAEMLKSYTGFRFRSHGHGDQVYGRFPRIGLGWLKGSVSMAAALIIFAFSLTATLVYWLNYPVISRNNFQQMMFPISSEKHQPRFEYSLNCSISEKCSENYPQFFEPDDLTTQTCPDYFRWIHHDLDPWKSSGITRETIERGKSKADFRLVIVNGEAYVENYNKTYQTRDVFTVWGIYQLLRLYPGKIPDLELMFNCADETMIMKKNYQGPNVTSPPPVFHYCGNNESLDIVFPDWTFWGWAELNINPWNVMLSSIKNGSKRIKWENRIPFAYWKGNPYVALKSQRKYLLKCNVSDKYDWGVRIYSQNWSTEVRAGFKNSKLEDQCTHRYKIYIEGATWSVSQKYILACDSMTLMVLPKYHDFYSRNLMPLQHYWPIRSERICRDLRFAVEWGNNHTDKTQTIGKAGSKLMEELTMQNVYDYMYHLLNEYAKLLKFKPRIPPKAERICLETTVCREMSFWEKFMIQSMVKSPSNKLPCALPPPYKPQEIQISLQTKEKMIRQVTREEEMWEADRIDYWNKIYKQ